MRPLIERYGEEVTKKADYQRDLRRYTRWDVPPLTRVVRTGGTSGQPLRFTADTFARRQKERAYLFDIWSQVDYAPYDLRVRYAGDFHGGMLRYNRLENVWVVSPGATVEGKLAEFRTWLGTLTAFLSPRIPEFALHIH